MTANHANRRGVLALLAGLAIAPRRAAGQTAPDGAERHIETLAQQAFVTLQRTDLTLDQRELEFRRILRDGFDLDFIARFVLGSHWKGASEEQRAEYLDLFAEFVLKTYAGRLGGYTGESFSIVGTRPTGTKDVIVATVISQPNGGTIDAEWRVRRQDSGYRIIDVAVAGISMVVNQRDEFASVVTNHGIDGLLQMLRARVGKVSIAAG
ncbi:MAG: ABC transporter substrate-binding protein [Alphaproteobacteria bacterium]|nr:ABC transporter substrate-binding protein [Alphaproteobacteria bacterium]